ncbi:MAG: heterodisulfide reductase subunit A [Candidatus Aenigmatarchaeota archaeon]|nr:MAG: heterodisulfide reductase subunit A [Candidatus Aenigmarchaeota archaeon]
MAAENKSILVVGGGMSGLTAAIEAAEAGFNTYIVEKNPYIGGRVTQIYHYFPKLCPPYCGLEINFRRIKTNPNIKVFTMAEVEEIKGEEGNFQVTVKINPRYVNERCTACGICEKECTAQIENPFNYGMDKVKAIYLPHPLAYPMRYVMESSYAKSEEAKKLKDICPYGAIDLDMKEERIELNVGAIIFAIGWSPYDAKKLDTYGFGKYKDVITNVMMERLVSWTGPTKGKILRPSDGKPPKRVAFVQCAGSRDENHLPYCSGVCCLASMKHARYIREQLPECEIYIFFIDIRATDRMEDFYNSVKDDEKIKFFKGKVAKITEKDGKLLLKVEDTTAEALKEIEVDLVVLATGMQPNSSLESLPIDLPIDEYGFIASHNPAPGIYAAGCTRKPTGVAEAVQDGTAAALRAIQSLVRR